MENHEYVEKNFEESYENDKEPFDDQFDDDSFDSNDLDDDVIAQLSSPLEEITENDEDFDDEEPDDLQETKPEETPEETKERKKRISRLSKLGAKSIVKGLDIGNANLCRLIAYSDSALEYRADPEAIEDLTELVDEMIPTKPGQDLKIPLWLQAIIYILIAFLPVLITALSDRRENKQMKEYKNKLKKLKKDNKLLKKQIEIEEKRKELDDMNKQSEHTDQETDEIETNIKNGKGVNTDQELEDKEKTED